MKEFDFLKYQRKNSSKLLINNHHNFGDFFRIAIIIPVLAEYSNLAKTLQSIKNSQNNFNEEVLVVLVFNHGKNTPQNYIDENQEIIKHLKVNSNLFHCHNLTFIECEQPLKYGVGEARKIGMDSAIPIISNSQNAENSIIISLDADTIVEKDYLQKISDSFNINKKYGAIAFDCQHQKSNNSDLEKAIRIYEEYIEGYYQLLKYANSPFAYKTLGSAFACRVSSYIQSGGMKRVVSGEDFYFLEAVAKTNRVYFDTNIVVHPSPRLSDRVIFGTGRAVEEIIKGKQYNTFSQVTHEELKKLLDSATNNNLQNGEYFLTLQSEKAKQFLENMKFLEKWQQVIENCRQDQLEFQFKYLYFDALKTLQFVKSK